MKVNYLRLQTGPARSPQLDMAAGREKRESDTMRKQLTLLSLCFGLAALFSTAHGAIPSMDVTVFDATGKVVFKQAINGRATFATGNLPAGKYVVQFNTRSAAAKGNQYLFVVSAGKKKVIAEGVAGETLTRGGAAMKIQVSPNSEISGQVLNDEAIAEAGGPKYRTIDGRRYVWVGAQTGTHLAGQWQEVSPGPTRSVVVWTRDELQKRMDRGGEGSMISLGPDAHHGMFPAGH
jgi:hypothetical protein